MEKRTNKTYHIRYFRVAAALTAVFVCVVVLVFVFLRDGSDVESNSSSQGEADSLNAADSMAVNAQVKPQEHGMTDLKEKIKTKFAEYPGQWSAYVKNLNTGEFFTINDRQIYPASIIKLFALGACYQQIHDGIIKEDDYYTYIYSMAVMSNNVAFNKIIWTIGRDYLTKWCHENGYANTSQYHGLSPADNAEGLATSDKPNETCASDVGRMLESIYRGECVSKEASQKMLKLLEQQHWVNKIPSGLPPNTHFANKTGDTADYSHDGAIVYSPGADYIIVIMSENPMVSFQQDHRFIEISKMVYEYFNPGG